MMGSLQIRRHARRLVWISALAVLPAVQAQTGGFPIALGGEANDAGLALAIHTDGSIAVVGEFASGNAHFGTSPTAGSIRRGSNGGFDAFVVRYDAMGRLLWAKTFGGNQNDNAHSVAIDANGDVIVGGVFVGQVDFEPDAAVPFDMHTSRCLSTRYCWEGFVARYNPMGRLLWVKPVGGFGGANVALDSDGSIVVAGRGNLARYDAAGTRLWAKGQGEDGWSVAIDARGNIVVVGMGRLARYDAGGTRLWVKTLATADPSAVAVDARGDIVITGGFTGTVDFDPDTVIDGDTRTSNGGYDAYVARYSASGTLAHVKILGGPFKDWGHGVAIDAQGHAVVAGNFGGTVDFDPDNHIGSDMRTARPHDATDVFVARYDAAGTLVSVTTFGDTNFDFANGVALDAAGSAVVTGSFIGEVDFHPDVASPGDTRLSAGSADVFVARHFSSGSVQGSLMPEATTLELTVLSDNRASARAVRISGIAPAPGANVEVIDLLGRLVRRTGAVPEGGEVALSGLVAGVYVVRATAGPRVGTTTVVVH